MKKIAELETRRRGNTLIHKKQLSEIYYIIVLVRVNVNISKEL